MRNLLLPLLLSLPLAAAPVDPVVARTQARVAQLNRTTSSSNAYPQLKSVMLGKDSPVRAEARPLAEYLSIWPETRTTLQKISESKTFASDRAKFEKVAKQVGPALQLPVFYAPQDFKQDLVPNWMGLRTYCMAQNVLGIYLLSQGKDGMELLGNSLVSAQRISSNGILLQQMIALNVSNAACESLFQVLQGQPKLPLVPMQKLQQRLQKFPLPKAGMANALDMEELWFVTRLGEDEPKALATYTRFHAKWRSKVENLIPTDTWRADYLEERDEVTASSILFMGLREIDYTVLTNHWREGLERRQLLDLLLSLEITKQQKGAYPTSLKLLPDTKYTRNGKTYMLESTSRAWDTKGVGADRKVVTRRFHSPKAQ